MTKLTYRPDIDALRALAVISVIFFHIKADLLPGGFLGVDIFFVISGYLITKIILGHDGTTRSFFPEFYERRIRRLIPPAIPVVIFSFVAGIIWLSAGQLESLSKSIIAYSGFVSNWLFLSEVNYFDVPAHYKPLLHTWSLSVEEQFYLLFPVIILFLKKIHAKWVSAFYALAFLASLALSYFFMFTGNNEAIFFNSFARFWEIALGGLLACGVLPNLKSKALQESLTAIGLLMIAASLFLVRETMDFNGLGSLAPTLGTAMVIHAKSQGIGKLISLPPVRGIGLISYAMYLWHWPLFVYIKFIFPSAGAIHYLVAIILTIILATGSYFLIEKPIRTKTFLKSRTSAYALFLAITMLFIDVSIATLAGKGWPQRYSDAENYTKHRNAQLIDWREKTLRTKCWIGHRDELQIALKNCIPNKKTKPQILLVGDSHAAHLLPGLKKNFPDKDFILLSVDSCYLMKRRNNASPACTELIDWVDNTDLVRFEAVLYSGRGLQTDIPPEIMNQLNKIASETTLYFVGPVLFFEPNMPSIYPKFKGKISDDEIDQKFQAALSEEQFEKDKIFQQFFSDNPNINYISMTDIICPNNECEFRDPNGWPILIDNSHLSVEASEMFLRNFPLKNGATKE